MADLPGAAPGQTIVRNEQIGPIERRKIRSLHRLRLLPTFVTWGDPLLCTQIMKASTPPAAFAKPAPHHVIRGFLGETMVERLLEFALARREDFAPAKIGRQGRLDDAVRQSAQLCDLGGLKPILEAEFRAVFPAAIEALRIAPFDLTFIELQLVAHGDGAFYQRHIDTGTGGDGPNHRVLTGVYYFHALPKTFGGGALRLHSILPEEQGGSHVDIDPDRDTLLLFPSWAPHEVRPVSCVGGDFAQSRFALNCWFLKRAGA